MVVPTLTYCSLVNLNLNNTQKSKLLSLQNRASEIIYDKSATKEPVASIDGLRKSQACLFVRKCIKGSNIPPCLENYLEVRKHSINTRNNNHMINIPRMRTEYGKRSASYMCAKIYNEIPLELRKEDNEKKFKRLLKAHFK